MNTNIRVNFPMAAPADIALAREIGGRMLTIELHDESITLDPRRPDETGVRRIVGTMAGIEDQQAREAAMHQLLEIAIRACREAQQMAGVVLLIDKKTRESQAELLRRHPFQFPPPRG